MLGGKSVSSSSVEYLHFEEKEGTTQEAENL
jgi:hypothetical protein